MTFTAPPRTAAWRHLDARDGFEVAYFRSSDDGLLIEGCTTAVEEGQTWIVGYSIELDASWTTRSTRITGRSASGTRHTVLEADGAGHWRVDGAPAPHLDGCLDVDLESSAMTNAFPAHRMGLRVGDRSAAPAAYVRATDLAVERLEQDYVRVADEGPRQRYDYSAQVFDFACRLVYDESGLVLDYPEIAVRVA
ncbi:putative glycolipid-binding domain-containing protein [Streptosporangium sp. NPDC023963]|uniref:putative glycolipid-binding domain-containing protein n=1 Tax=Streptosporangium sp. NPDC023963 TaxID=3155608 RepID=UPI00341AAEFA